jgi:hypothetical protein
LKANRKTVRIGGASAFWGDSATGAHQLADVPSIDYLSFDYLAELTMSILAAARAKDPEQGYAGDFVDVAMRQILARCKERGIRVVSNAGGLNPKACARALQRLAAEQGIEGLKIAIVDGSDVLPLVPALRDQGVRDFYTDQPMPGRMGSANAYLGAAPVARALDAGADVVITGRVVDSALVLGALMHEFGWRETDLDLLAAGSLAGHIIECGCQATGGLHTDWERVPDWPNMGYPVIECASDGSFVLTKPEGTGGLIAAAAVAEQLLYEIGDPENYVLPDVVCDFSGVCITQPKSDEVRVSGARGKPAPPDYKVCATWTDGFTCTGTLSIVGFQAIAKARRSGEAVIARTRRMLAEAGKADLSAWNIEVIGAEEPYGAAARVHDLREAVVRIVARHLEKAALQLFAREIAPAGTSWSPGTTGSMAPGRPAVAPLVRLFTFTIPKGMMRPWMQLDDGPELPVPSDIDAVALAADSRTRANHSVPSPNGISYLGPPPLPDDVEVSLIRLAWARSGDKGDTSNVGIIARSAAVLPYLLREVTEDSVSKYLAHFVRGGVTRYFVPGIHAINLVMTRALGGGGMASMRYDPLGKAVGQILLAMPVRVPDWVLDEADCATRAPFQPGIASDRASVSKQEITAQ